MRPPPRRPVTVTVPGRCPAPPQQRRGQPVQPALRTAGGRCSHGDGGHGPTRAIADARTDRVHTPLALLEVEGPAGAADRRQLGHQTLDVLRRFGFSPGESVRVEHPESLRRQLGEQRLAARGHVGGQERARAMGHAQRLRAFHSVQEPGGVALQHRQVSGLADDVRQALQMGAGEGDQVRRRGGPTASDRPQGRSRPVGLVAVLLREPLEHEHRQDAVRRRPCDAQPCGDLQHAQFVVLVQQPHDAQRVAGRTHGIRRLGILHRRILFLGDSTQ